MADPADTARTDPVADEVARVAAAAADPSQPTVIVDDPDETGAPEGKEVVSGAAPAPTQEAAPAVAEPASAEVSAGAHKVALSLGDLSQRELERLQMAIEGELRNKGSEPDSQGPTLSEIASRLPVNEAATEAVSAAQAVAPFEGVEVGDVLTWKVRQKLDVEGNATGPAYLRIVTRDGQKLTAQHN
jgi:hypothetical protein